jgi:hypothetical protein
MVVSATPPRNTARFYLHRGFEPTAEPRPELYELEPEDVHLQKRLYVALARKAHPFDPIEVVYRWRWESPVGLAR